MKDLAKQLEKDAKRERKISSDSLPKWAQQQDEKSNKPKKKKKSKK